MATTQLDQPPDHDRMCLVYKALNDGKHEHVLKTLDSQDFVVNHIPVFDCNCVKDWQNGFSLLHVLAVETNCHKYQRVVGIITVCLDRGANGMCRNKNGDLPLHHMACIQGNDDVVNLLLERVPQSMDAQNDQGLTPLSCFERCRKDVFSTVSMLYWMQGVM